MNQLFDQFLHERRNLKNISPATETSYREAWRVYKRHTGTSEINQSLLNDWVVQMREAGRKPVSCNTSIRHINAFCNWLYQGKQLPERCRLSLLKVGETPRKTFSEASLKKIVKYQAKSGIELRIHTVLLFLIDTGARIGEVLGLTRTDVDLDRRLVRLIGKGQKERVVPISLTLAQVLRCYLRHHDFELVFCSGDGNGLSRKNLRRDFQNVLKLLGIEERASFHAIRHTVAYSFVRTFGKLTGDNKNSLFHLQKQLGHSNLSTTRIYVDLQPEDLRDAHEKAGLLTKLSSDEADD